MRSGASGTLWDLAALGCATGGSYIRVEDPADLQWALGDAHFRLGPSVSLGVDFAVALGDLGPPSGADVVLMLDLHVDLAGTLLTLADIPVPLRIP